MAIRGESWQTGDGVAAVTSRHSVTADAAEGIDACLLLLIWSKYDLRVLCGDQRLRV